jgi:hypothetical protein
MTQPPQPPQSPQPPPPSPARDNLQVTYTPLAEAGEYRNGAVLVATPLPGRATPPTCPVMRPPPSFPPLAHKACRRAQELWSLT